MYQAYFNDKSLLDTKMFRKLQQCNSSFQSTMYPVDTGRKLNVYKTFRTRPGRLLKVLRTFNLRPGSTGQSNTARKMKFSVKDFSRKSDHTK